MRAVVQRVSSCRVTVGDETTGAITSGLLVFLGVTADDETGDLDYIVRKIANLRIMEDDNGAMNLSLLDLGLQVCVVSQFTLYADVRKGRRPSFTGAAPPEKAELLYNRCIEAFRDLGLRTETGRFGARMQVSYTNEGPVTIIIDSKDR